MHMTLSYRYHSPRVLPCKHHIPGNCSSITMATVRVNRSHPGSWCLVVLFVDSSGSASPIPSDQPGPLSRSVKLRVSRTCNPLHKFFPHSLLADLWLLSRCLSASGHTTLPTNPVCARNLVIIYMMKYCFFFSAKIYFKLTDCYSVLVGSVWPYIDLLFGVDPSLPSLSSFLTNMTKMLQTCLINTQKSIVNKVYAVLHYV